MKDYKYRDERWIMHEDRELVRQHPVLMSLLVVVVYTGAVFLFSMF